MKRIFCCVAMLLVFLPSLGVMVSAQEQVQEPLSEMLAAKAQVDVNKADAATLALALDGVGMSKAQEIVRYREEFGDFTSIEELQKVRGIGPATIARNRAKILIVKKE